MFVLLLLLSTLPSIASANACATSARYWSISNAATFTCPGGGERFPEPSWRVGDLKFYSDSACSSELHVVTPLARASYAHWTPDKAFDGSVDTDWRDLDYSKIGDLDTYWIGGEFSSAVTVRCVKIYQGYHCAGNQNCPGGKGWHWVDSVFVRASDDGVNWTKVGPALTGLGCESGQQGHQVGCTGGVPPGPESQTPTTTAPPTFPPVPLPTPIRDESDICPNGVASGRFWSISNNQAFACPSTGKQRFPEPSWRVNELKFYSDFGCTRELTVFQPLGGGSAGWWHYSNSRGGRDATNPDYAFDGTSDYYRAMDTYTIRDTDKLWIGADLGRSVTVRCIKLDQGYSCDMNDYCGNTNGWQTVDSVNLRYSEDGVSWTNVEEKITGLGCEEDLSSQNGYPITPACDVPVETVPQAWWCVYVPQWRWPYLPSCNGSGRRLEGEAEPDFAMAPTPEEMEAAFEMEAQFTE